MILEKRLKMKKRLKVKLFNIDKKKEKKSTNFLIMHDLDPNINKPETKKTKKFKEDEV